jgi:hypothetical protein
MVRPRLLGQNSGGSSAGEAVARLPIPKIVLRAHYGLRVDKILEYWLRLRNYLIEVKQMKNALMAGAWIALASPVDAKPVDLTGMTCIRSLTYAEQTWEF